MLKYSSPDDGIPASSEEYDVEVVSEGGFRYMGLTSIIPQCHVPKSWYEKQFFCNNIKVSLVSGESRRYELTIRIKIKFDI